MAYYIAFPCFVGRFVRQWGKVDMVPPTLWPSAFPFVGCDSQTFSVPSCRPPPHFIEFYRFFTSDLAHRGSLRTLSKKNRATKIPPDLFLSPLPSFPYP